MDLEDRQDTHPGEGGGHKIGRVEAHFQAVDVSLEEVVLLPVEDKDPVVVAVVGPMVVLHIVDSCRHSRLHHSNIHHHRASDRAGPNPVE
jgi:hypothetical protein